MRNHATWILFGTLYSLTACANQGEESKSADTDLSPSSTLEAEGAIARPPGEVMGDPSRIPNEAVKNDSKLLVEENAYIAEGYAQTEHNIAAGGTTFRVLKSQRGSTIPIPESTIASLCGDFDGCKLRMGMYDWDNAGRVASRENLFFYNTVNHAWRAMGNDVAGSDYNGTTEHIMQSWACYFTDGHYSNWTNYGDGSVGFGLLSWNQYNAECWLTIID